MRKNVQRSMAWWLATTFAGWFLATGIMQGWMAQASPAAELSYYLAAKAEPLPGEPRPASDLSEEPDWMADEYMTLSGTRVPILRQRTPSASLRIQEVREVVGYRPPWNTALFPESTAVETRIVVDEQLREAFRAIANSSQGYWLLVISDGRRVDLAPVGANLGDAVPGGVFASEEEARAFYSPIGDQFRLEPSRHGEILSWRGFFEESAAAVMWHLKCDPDFRAALEDDGYDVSMLLEGLGDNGSNIDCLSSEAPELPAAP